MRCDEILQWLPTFRFLVYRGNASQLAAVEKETIAVERFRSVEKR